MPLIDFITVQHLQMRNPGTLQEDHTFVEEQMSQQMLFSMITEEGTRFMILHRLQKVKHILPSLHTFIEDTKWLEPCAKAMSRLLPTHFKGSIQHALLQILDGPEKLQIQLTDTDTSFASASGTSLQVVESAYQ